MRAVPAPRMTRIKTRGPAEHVPACICGWIAPWQPKRSPGRRLPRPALDPQKRILGSRAECVSRNFGETPISHPAYRGSVCHGSVSEDHQGRLGAGLGPFLPRLFFRSFFSAPLGSSFRLTRVAGDEAADQPARCVWSRVCALPSSHRPPLCRPRHQRHPPSGEPALL